ncbi:MAG: hypothetical protein HW416_3232 [Chloroflexi bacterium]|nr:hypothetical protein [Chloroflexota bacterium]
MSRPLISLAFCGLASVLTYAVAFTLPYPLENGLAKPLLHFGRMAGPSLGPTMALVGSLALLFAAYVVALRVCLALEGSRFGLALVLAVGALSSLVLLNLYPIFSLDVFYYISADRIWSVYHENPFVVPPLQGAHDPFFPYTAWGHYPLPYGPLWPWITLIPGLLGGGQIQATLLSFKGLAVLGYLLCLPLVTWAVRGVRPDRAVTGTCLFAWNPLILIELPGMAHNDAIALVPAVFALGLWARHHSVGAALGLAISFLVKATIVVAIPVLLWPSLRRAAQQTRLARWIVTHGIPAIALYFLAWTPFWTGGGGAEGFFREADQHYQSLTTLAVGVVPTTWAPITLRVFQVAILAAFVWYYRSQLLRFRDEGRPAVRVLWRVTVAYFLVVSPFYSAWYMAWPVLYAALLCERRYTVLTTLLCIGGLGTHVVEFVVRPLVVPAVGWVQLNALGLLVAAGPFLVGSWLLNRQEQLDAATRLSGDRRRRVRGIGTAVARCHSRRVRLHGRGIGNHLPELG